MEFELDTDSLRAIVAQEYRQALADIDTLGPIAAYERSRARHDDRLASASDAHTLACKAGCFWCCYFSVDVRAVEVFAILEFMKRELSSEEQIRIRADIEANALLLKGVSEDARAQRNVKCPFLYNGRCSIYTARPQTCRNYHATDAAGCERSYNEPDNIDIDPEFAPLVYQFGGSHVEAFAKAMTQSGYDIAAYELNSALHEALADPTAARGRFESRVKPFSAQTGTYPDSVFLDLSD